MKKKKELIPKNTPYCHYNKMEAYPYWSCKYLGIKDTYQGSTLLWDMCKECDEGEDYE